MTQIETGSLRWGLLFLSPLAVLVLLGGCQPEDQPDDQPVEVWQEFAPQGAGFAILLPGAPAGETRSEQNSAGLTEIHRLSLEREGDRPSYRVESFRYPEKVGDTFGTMAERQPEDFFGATGRYLATELGGTVSRETVVSLDGHRGTEVHVDGPEGRTTIARIYFIGDRLYRLSVATPSGEASQDQVRRFFASFRPIAPSDPPDDPDA